MKRDSRSWMRLIRLRRDRYGFTLIELLVVVSIIALLVSILLPALSQARRQTRKVTCATNLKQIYLGMVMYVDHSDDKLPHTEIDKDTTLYPPPGGEWYPDQWFWQQIIAEDVNVQREELGWNEYSAGYEVFYCTAWREMQWKPLWGNYGLNDTYCTRGTRPQYAFARIVQPSQRILILDNGSYLARGMDCKYPTGYFQYVPSAIEPGTDPADASGFPITLWLQDDYKTGRHDGMVNIAWADGHVAPEKGLELGDRVRDNDWTWWKQ